MRRMILVKKEFFHGYLCSDCGWIRSASIETLRDKPSTIDTKKAFNVQDCSQYPLSPQMVYYWIAAFGSSSHYREP
jgi:hypothetical protein